MATWIHVGLRRTRRAGLSFKRRVLAGLLAATSPCSAWAQTTVPEAEGAQPAMPEPEASEAGQDIVVTAQRRSQRLQDVPISVAVTSRETLQRLNLTSLESVAVRTPAVRIAVAPVSDFIAVRGVGSSLNLGFEQSVATFVDGIYRSRSRSTRAALFDVEQVEILKGPQTTFFGNNAIAGALNITTRKPGSVPEMNASLFYAPDTREVVGEAAFSLPLTDDLSIRVAGRANQLDGYVRNVNLGTDTPNLSERIGRVSVAWSPIDALKIDARFDIGGSRNRNVFSTQVIDCPPNAVFGPPRGVCARYLAASNGHVDDELNGVSAANPSFFDYDYKEAALTAAIDVGASSLVFTSGYFDHSYDLLNDVSPIPAARGGSVVGTSQTVPARFQEHFKQFSQEVRFQSATGGVLEYLAGAYYSHGELDISSFQGFYFAPFGANAPGFYNAASPIAINVLNSERSETLSAFGAITVRPTSKLRLNAGLRYSRVEKTAHRAAALGTAGSIPGDDNFVAGPAGAQAILLPVLGVDQGDFDSTNRADKKLMPTASVQYDFAASVMGYASYSKGFKAGGFSGFTSKSIFDPETVDAYEVGLKSSLFGRRLTLNLTGFWSEYRNLQETATILLETGSQRQVVGNVARSRVKGVELGSSLRLAEGFSITGDLAYLDARYQDYVDAPCTVLQSLTANPCSQDLSGKRRSFAPEWSGAVGVSYEHAVTDSLQARLDTNLFFTSRFFQQPLADINLSQSSYAKLDARLGFGPADRRWEIAVVGKNLTNKRTASYRQPVATAPGTFQALEEPDRSIGIQLATRF